MATFYFLAVTTAQEVHLSLRLSVRDLFDFLTSSMLKRAILVQEKEYDLPVTYRQYSYPYETRMLNCLWEIMFLSQRHLLKFI